MKFSTLLFSPHAIISLVLLLSIENKNLKTSGLYSRMKNSHLKRKFHFLIERDAKECCCYFRRRKIAKTSRRVCYYFHLMHFCRRLMLSKKKKNRKKYKKRKRNNIGTHFQFSIES